MKYLDIKSNKDRMIINLRKMGFKNILLIGHYSYKEAKKKLEMHQHKDMLEICFLETGSQYYQIGEDTYFLKGGDLLITPPNTVHGTSMYPEEKGSLFWLIIRVPKTSFKILNLTPKESKALIYRILNIKKKHFKGASNLKKTLSAIFFAYNKKDDFLSKIEITNHLLHFLLSVIHYGEKTDKRNISSSILFCCNYIEKNMFQKIYISNLAAQVHLSESRFKHKFKEEIGIPPNEYILKTKINCAKELIQKRKASFTDIAYDLGFSSSSYFSTVFKKYEGKTPSEYQLKFN